MGFPGVNNYRQFFGVLFVLVLTFGLLHSLYNTLSQESISPLNIFKYKSQALSPSFHWWHPTWRSLHDLFLQSKFFALSVFALPGSFSLSFWWYPLHVLFWNWIPSFSFLIYSLILKEHFIVQKRYVGVNFRAPSTTLNILVLPSQLMGNSSRLPSRL